MTVDDLVPPEDDTRLPHEADLEIEGVRHVLKIKVPAETVAACIDRVACALRDRARLPGFRQGKAPLNMVRQQFSEEIRKQVLDQLLPEHVRDELDARNLVALNSPVLDDVDYDAHGPLRFTVRFDVAPNVELGHYTNLQAKRKQVDVDGEMVDRALSDLRERAARLVPAPDKAKVQKGDFVQAQISLLPRDGKGKRLGEENRFVHVGEEVAIPGLNAQLEALSAGDEREFITQLADAYPNAMLAGKEVTCRVRIEEIKRQQVPEIDDEFAKDLGFDDLENLRQHTVEELEHRVELSIEQSIEEQLLQQLRIENPVDVPPSLVERRLDQMTQRATRELEQQGVEPNEGVDWSRFRSENRPVVKHGLAEEMLLDQVANKEQIQVADEAVNQEICDQLQKNEDGSSGPLVSLTKQMRQDGSYEAIRLTLRRRLALAHLKRHARIETEGSEAQQAQ